MSDGSIEGETRSGFVAWSRALPGILLVALAFLFACNEIADFDFWWHLRTGQLIAERGVPQTDWYSFTEPDRRWIDVHWGFQVLIAYVFAGFGIPGVMVLKGILASATMVVALSAYRGEWSRYAQFWILLPSLVVMSSRFYERPEMLTLLFTSMYLSILLHADRKPWLLWFLPLIQLIWSNVQGLFVFGPILLAMYWMQVLLQWGRTKRKGWLAGVSLLVGLACMASPYGIWNVAFVFELWEKMDPEAGKFYRSYIGELRDVRSFLAEGGWSAGTVWVLFGMLGLGAIGVALRWREIARGELFRVLPVVAFSWLGLQAIRNGSHFALVVGVLTAWNIGPSFPARAVSVRWQPIGAAMACLLIAVSFVGGGWGQWMGAHRRFGLGLHPEQFSFDAMEVCAKPGMPDKAVAFHLGHAATYIYRCGPDRTVYMDPRLEVHTQEMLRRYRDLQVAFDTGGDWSRVLDSYGVNLVVASSEHSLGVQAALLCSSYWKCVYWDEVAGVFLRATWPMPEGVQEFDFRTLIWSDVPAREPESALRLLEFPGSPIRSRESRRSRTADHLLRLAQAIAGQPQRRDEVLRRVLWAAVHTSVEKVDGLVVPSHRRVYGISLVTLADIESGRDRVGGPFDPFVESMQGVGARILRTMTAHTTDEVSAAFYFQDLLAKQGAVDESVAVLERLSRRWPANAAQAIVFEGLPKLLAERKQKLEQSPALAPEPTSWEEFVAYRRAGRLGALIDLVEKRPEIVAALRTEERVELSRWCLSIGRVVDFDVLTDREIADVHRESFGDRVEVGLLEAMVEWSRFENLNATELDCEPGTAECELMRATQSVVRGDLSGFARSVERGESLGPGPRAKRQLVHLRELLVEEVNDG